MGLFKHIIGMFSDKGAVGLKLASNSTEINEFKEDNSNSAINVTALAPKKEQDYAADVRNLNNFNTSNYAQFIRLYLNKNTLDNAINTNPNIRALLKEYKLPCEYNIQNVTSIIMSHLIPCAKTAQKIFINLGYSKNSIAYTNITQAALLHDIGKVFIPQEILYKRGKLNNKEREIIELHNKLSYEILITTNLNKEVVKLTLEHHDYENCVIRNESNQALTIADVYCALREKRSYKKALNDICAKTILYDMGTKGKFDSKYISYIK